jgi:hypothetical protein
MRVTAVLVVKGTRYYKAGEMRKKGLLVDGVDIRLLHQPENPYDHNAVAVLLKSNEAMLGHLSRDLAPKYAALANAGRILESSVSSVSGGTVNPDLKIRICYELAEQELAQKRRSRFWLTANSLPLAPGVYSITNTVTGRQYIGASSRVKERVLNHLRTLSDGSHVNRLLQEDFAKGGADKFEVSVIASCQADSEVNEMEAYRVQKLLSEGKSLYNLTIDGQGSVWGKYQDSDHEPVSDRMASHQSRQQLQEDRRRIYDRFDQRLKAASKNLSYWHCFLGAFIAMFAGTSMLLTGTKNIVILLISGGLACIVAVPVKSYLEERAKRSPRYQSLAREREEALAALTKEKSD